MDARIAKTRARLQDALFELADQHGIERVTVSDITHRAGVNRTTFYLHYADTQTLLADAIDTAASRAGAGLDRVDITSRQPPQQLTEFLVHADANAALYRRVFTEPGFAVALSRLRARLIDAIMERLAASPSAVRVEAPGHVVAASIAGSVLGAIGAWLADEPRADPTTAALWVWQIVAPHRDVGD